jgi:hypothetical protein
MAGVLTGPPGGSVWRPAAASVLLSCLLLATAILTACQAAPTPEPDPTITPAALSQVTESPPTGYSYPPPTSPVISEAYPVATGTAEPSLTPGPVPTLDDTATDLFLPLVKNPDLATATPLPPAETAVPSPTPYPTLDFTAVRAELAAQGVAFAPVPIGYQVGV